MRITSWGRDVLDSWSKISEHDFKVVIYDSERGECCVIQYTRPTRALAVHEGTTVELARLWKLALITRRLSQ